MTAQVHRMPSSAGNESALLEVDGLTKSFKGLRAVDGYSVRLRPGEILGIIGPNGAGKSTLFNLFTGHLRATHGTIRFAGQEITRLSPSAIARLGVGRTFQNIRLFSSMSVLGNAVCARQLHAPRSLAAALVSAPSFLRAERALEQAALEDLRLFGLDDRADLEAVALPYGDQRRLEVVRALALRPKLLLLDEPTAGMSARESEFVLELIRRVHAQYALAMIVVEHNLPLVMRLCERIQVLSYGRIIAEGTPEQIRTDPLVIESYLGKVVEDAEARRS